MAARVAAQGLSRGWLNDDGAALAERQVPADRLPGDQLLLGAGTIEAARAAWTRSTPSCSRPTTSSASRSTSRSCSPGVAVDAIFDSVSVGTTIQGRAGQARDHLLLVRRGGARASRAGAEVPRLGRAVQRQLLRRAQRRGVHRRLVRLHPEGRALPDGAVDLLPHQRADTGQFERTLIIADEGAYVSYLEGCTAPKRDDEPAARRGRRAGRARGRDDQVLDRAELVRGRRGGAGRHLQLRHQARQVRRRELQDLAGPRSRPARRSPGSIRA